MDNIRVYSGSKPHTDAELGIVPSGSVLAGVQFSAVKANKYGMRLVGTVDGLNYASVGTDLSFSWKENGETKTKTASKTASAVYDSILATADGAIEAYTAENLGGKYLWALTVDGIPTAAGEVTVDVDCWSMTDGVKTVQCPDAAGGEGREAALVLCALTKGDCDMKRTYEMPAACLLTFENDIICTSGLVMSPAAGPAICSFGMKSDRG